jgi:hypothetical protein
MLKTLDILIGVATIMLLFSMAVTIITQAVTQLREHRGKSLLQGLAGLLRQIDPTLVESVATKIADVVLRHPLVAGPKGKLGDVIHREEFTVLLMSIAAGESPDQPEEAVKKALIDLLGKNGIPSPGETLKDIRAAALQLEAASPALANDIRHAKAILQEAQSQYVAKVNGWFDQTIDRVSSRFTLTARLITFTAALVVAVTVQLDTFALVNRLSVDDQFRAAVAKDAEKLMQKAAEAQQSSESQGSGTAQTATPTPSAPASQTPPAASTPAQVPAPAPSPSPTSATASQPAASPSPAPTAESVQFEYYNLLSSAGLITMPGQHWVERFTAGKLPGILLSALLLSLGAPFWYCRLQDLLRLRSALAQKDEAQRNTRQTTQTAGDQDSAEASITAAVADVIMPGEQGDMTAVG